MKEAGDNVFGSPTDRAGLLGTLPVLPPHLGLGSMQDMFCGNSNVPLLAPGADCGRNGCNLVGQPSCRIVSEAHGRRDGRGGGADAGSTVDVGA
jgi:hypothetical protein